jgi:hypothetical protein
MKDAEGGEIVKEAMTGQSMMMNAAAMFLR